jgi:hypothetical protein
MNLIFTEAKLQDFVVHKVGNKIADEPCFIANDAVVCDDQLKSLLCQYFLNAFKSEEVYRFHHDMDLSYNEVYSCVKQVFENPETLYEQSTHLAKQLYNKSTHPKIKGGEFYMVYFKDCSLNGERHNAVGLFKSENKDTFLEVEQDTDGFIIESREGININKLDKGCLIFDSEAENGYLLSIVDNTNRGTEAQYWKDDFLSVMVLNNEFHQTNQFLGIAKHFVTQQLNEDFVVTKAVQIDYLNRSVDYFKSHDTFDKQQFEEEVFGDNNVIQSFRKFDENYRTQNEVDLADSFEISAQAVKKQARVFKSVLKLDRNFHIYIHGSRELIEHGIDESGRKFYKIYYEEEN